MQSPPPPECICCSLVCVLGTLVKLLTQIRTIRGGVDEGGVRPRWRPSLPGGRRQEAGGWAVGKRPVVGRTAQIQVQAFTCQLCAFESSHDLGGCAYS